MIPVTVENLTISNVGFVVLLKSRQDERTLPIYIGPPEAQAILFKLNKVSLPRPMTHDLVKSLLDVLEARLDAVIVSELKDGTYYAKLQIHFEGQTLEVDSRPSDAIALALRTGTQIAVSEAVMDEAGVVLENEDQKRETVADEEKDPVAMLKKELDRAIQEERYEDAARIRDQLKSAEQSN